MRSQVDVFRLQVRYAVSDHPDNLSSKAYTCSHSCWHALRYYCRSILTSSLWVHFMMVLICVTLVLLGATIPPYEGRWFCDAATYAILGINAVFALEMLMKMVTYGVVLPIKQEGLPPAKSYFTRLLNWFDFISIILVFIFPKSVFPSMLKIARFSMPPETTVQKRRKVGTLWMVINTVVISIPEFFVLTCVLLYYCIWWSTAGVIVLGDRLNYRCYPPATIDYSNCMANLTNCSIYWPPIDEYLSPWLQLPCAEPNTTLLWSYGRDCKLPGEVCAMRPDLVTFPITYQNVLTSLLRTFQVVLMSDVWQLNINAAAAMGSLIFPYYVLPVLAGAYGLFLLFPVLFLKNYAMTAGELRSADEREHGAAVEDFSVPPGRIRQQMQLFVEGKVFMYGMLLITWVASLSIMIDWTGISGSLLSLLNILTIVCWVLFIIEALLKMVAYGVKGYFSQGLNVMDFSFILLEAVKVILDLVNTDLGGFQPWLDGMESLRILRLLRTYIQLPLGLTLNTMAEAFIAIFPKYLLLEVFHLGILWLFTIAYCNVGWTLDTGSLAPGFGNLLTSFSTTLPASTGQKVAEDLAFLFTTTTISGLQIFALSTVSIFLVVFAYYILVPIYLAVQMEHFADAMRRVSSKTLAFRHYDSVDPRNAVLRHIFDERFDFAEDREGNTNEAARLEFYQTDPVKLAVPRHRFMPRPRASPRLAALLLHHRWLLVRDASIVVHSVGAVLMLKGNTDLVILIGKGICGFCLLFLAFQIVAALNVYGLRAQLKARWPMFDVVAFIFGCAAYAYDALNALVFLRLLVVLQERFSVTRLVIRGILKRADCLLMATLLALTLFLAFGTFGVKLLKGRFHTCLLCLPTPDDGQYERRACNVATPVASYCNYTACMAANVTGDEKVVWVNEALNFDNLLEALMTMLGFTSNQGWADVMLNGLHVQSSEGGCIGGGNSGVNIIYFTALLTVCFYISMTWYTAIMAYFLAKHRIVVAPYDSLEERHQEWVKLMIYYTNEVRLQQYVFQENVLGGPGHIKPTCYQKLRMRLIQLFQQSWYGIAFAIAEALLALLFIIQYSGSPQVYKDVLKYGTLGLVLLWTVEAILKMIAYHPRAYLACRFFRFELATLVLDYLFFIINFYCGNLAIYGWPRLFRLGVLLGHVWAHVRRAGGQLVQFQFRPIHPMLGTVGFVLRGIVSVLAVYAVFVGCLAFFAVRVLYNIQVDNWVVTSGVSFRTWGEAWLQVHAMATGSYWVRILELVRQGPPFCSYAPEDPNPCLGIGAIIFCVVPPLVGLMTLTLTIAVVVDNAAIIELDRAKPTFLLQRFAQAWARVDVRNTRKMELGTFMLLWRWLQEQHPKPQVMHAGLQQILDPSLGRHRSLMARLGFPVILWPVDSDHRVGYVHAIHAIICHLAEVGFVEHHLLSQLLTPFEQVVPTPFFSVFHVRFSQLLAAMWEAWLPVRTNEMLRRRRHLDEQVRCFLKACATEDDSHDIQNEVEMDFDFSSATPHTTPNFIQRPNTYHPDELLEYTHRSRTSESSSPLLPAAVSVLSSQRSHPPQRGRPTQHAENNEWICEHN
eukprot:EG_transcript_293